MRRRTFLKAAGTGAAGLGVSASLATPALAQSQPALKWKLTTSFPKSLDILHEGAETFARAVSEATDKRFEIEVFAAGALAPAFKAADAVESDAAQMAVTASYYFLGKDLAFALPSAVPFGLNARMQNAWQYQGGGIERMNRFYERFNIHALPCGNTGTQMAGWFRREINDVSDLKGLRFRVGGFAASVLSRLGVETPQVAAGDIAGALEKGELDAAEWIGPHDDLKLGFHKVAPIYHYPAWWEGGMQTHLFTNLDRWNKLPRAYQTIVRNAADMTNHWILGRYDTLNPVALKQLLREGAKLKPFSPAVLDACRKAADEVYDEVGKTNPEFKSIWDEMVTFRDDQYLWKQVADFTYDSYMIRSRRRG